MRIFKTPPLATPDKNIRGQEGEDGGAKYYLEYPEAGFGAM
jgi:hypothetical protein